MLNAGLRAWSHQYLYDDETLTTTLHSLGFEVISRDYGRSDHPDLKGLDTRDAGEGSSSMYFDCRKKPA